MNVKIKVSFEQDKDFERISKVILHEVKIHNPKYINIIFVDESSDWPGIWDNADWNLEQTYVEEIIFNNQSKEEIDKFLIGCMKVIPKANISEVILNGFNNKTLNSVFEQSWEDLKEVKWLRIENTEKLEFETLKHLKDNSIVSN